MYSIFVCQSAAQKLGWLYFWYVSFVQKCRVPVCHALMLPTKPNVKYFIFFRSMSLKTFVATTSWASETCMTHDDLFKESESGLSVNLLKICQPNRLE